MGEKGGGGKDEQDRVMKGILAKGTTSQQVSRALVESVISFLAMQVPPTTGWWRLEKGRQSRKEVLFGADLLQQQKTELVGFKRGWEIPSPRAGEGHGPSPRIS